MEQNRKKRGRIMSNINNNTPLDAILQELKAAISELPAKNKVLLPSGFQLGLSIYAMNVLLYPIC